MSFVNDLKELFGESDLYKVLKIKKNSSEDQIKKAYRKLALEVHPDKVSPDHREVATRKFQALSKISKTLLDVQKRANYDKYGITDDLLNSLDENTDWYQYWRELFPTITIQDITNYESRYKGSDEERLDIKQSYLKRKGNLLKIIDDIPFLSINEIDRLRKIIDELIDKNLVPLHKKYNKNIKSKIVHKKKTAAREAKRAERELNNIKNSKNDALVPKTAGQERFSDMLENLAAKYCAKKKKNSKPKA